VGTKVCLRCRQDARDIARARQQRVLTKLGLAAVGLVGVYIVGASIINASLAAFRARGMHAMPTLVTTASPTADVRPQGEPRTAVPASATSSVAPIAPSVAPAAAPAAPVASPTAGPATVTPITPLAAVKITERASAPLKLVVREGRTELKDDILAQRTGDTVVVDFDLVMSRTRRRDKFERVVRETLPALYGAQMDSVLAAIPEGSLVPDGDLLTELPVRGIHVPLGTGYQLTVWPETRRGRDGLLVVGYRAQVVKG
jgi:hypothetical protein